MALTITSGGSLRTALALTLLAWGIRALRGAALRSILEDTSNRFQNIKGFNFLLSRLLMNRKYKNAKAVGIPPHVFRFLVQENPVPFVVFKVFREDRSLNHSPRIREITQQQQQQQQQNSIDHSQEKDVQKDLSVGNGVSEEEASTRGILSQVQCLPEHALKELLIRSLAPRALHPSHFPTHRHNSLGSLLRSHHHQNHNQRRDSDGGGGDRGGHISNNNNGGSSNKNSLSASQEEEKEKKGNQRLLKSDLVVLLSDEDDKHIQQLTSFTCDLGYRCVYVRGGVQALSSSSEEETTEVEALSRDAIFSLMYLYKTSQIRQSREREGGKEKGLQDKDHASTSPKNYVFDVRRHDELTLFGAFEGANHLPAGQLPHCLHLTGEEWQKKFRYSKPEFHDIVILICNTGLRSKWATKLFKDLGFSKVYYSRDGTNTWHLDATLCDYQPYEFGSSDIPTPKSFAIQQVNFERGQHELTKLGLLKYMMD